MLVVREEGESGERREFIFVGVSHGRECAGQAHVVGKV